MCDYSIQANSQHPAVVGERLTIRTLGSYGSRGFSPPGEPDTAVCLRPGNEVIVELTPELARTYGLPQQARAKFQYSASRESHSYRDELVFQNGKKKLIQRLPIGLMAEVALTATDEATVEKIVESASPIREMAGAGTLGSGSAHRRIRGLFFSL